MLVTKQRTRRQGPRPHGPYSSVGRNYRQRQYYVISTRRYCMCPEEGTLNRSYVKGMGGQGKLLKGGVI